MGSQRGEYKALGYESICCDSEPKNAEKQNLISTSKNADSKVLSSSHQYAMLITLLGMHYFLLCSESLLYPFFGAAAKRKGLVDTQIGFVYAAYEVIRCVAAPLYGVMITKLKPREMCFIGSITCGAGLVLFGLNYYTPDKWFYTFCLLIRVLVGNGSIMFTVAMTSGLLKVTTFKTTTIIAAIESTLQAGYSSGPLVGAALYQVGGYSMCFLVTGAVTTLLSFLVLPIVPKIDEISNEKTTSGAKEFLNIMSIPGVLIGGFMTMAAGKFGSNIVFSFAAEWFRSEYGISETLASTFYIVSCLVCAASCYPSSLIISKGYVWSLLTLCAGTYGILMLFLTPKLLVMSFPTVRYEWWYTVVIYGVQAAIYSPMNVVPYEASLHLASVNGYDKNSLKTHGLLAGVINSGLNLGAALSPMASGAITEKLGFEWNGILSAIIYLTLTLVYIIYLGVMKWQGKLLKPPEAADREEMKKMSQ